MSEIKNERIMYGYAELETGGYLLLVGISEIGWSYLKKEDGNFLTANPSGMVKFNNVSDVIIVRGETIEDVRRLLKEAQLTISNKKRMN